MTSASVSADWNTLQRTVFRFAFVYFLSFILFVNNGAFPYMNYAMNYVNDGVLHKFIPWVGKHLLHLPYEITTFTNGSGDTTYDYVLLLCIVIVSACIGLVWNLLAKKDADYSRGYYWLMTGVRYYLAFTMINYGLVKVFKLQFPAPGLYRLTEPYGESSPMGLAWTFLGFSKGYNMFMGFAELCGIFLLFRRTTTLGAAIILMVSANVMAMNYCFDIPVKIISTHLVLMCMVLLSNDLKVLLRFFFTREPVALHTIAAPVYSKRWQRIGRGIIKYGLIGFVLLYGTYDIAQYEKQYGDDAPKSSLYGIYTPDVFHQGNDTSLTGDMAWKQMIVEANTFARIRYVNDSNDRFFIDTDTLRHTVVLKNRIDTFQVYNLHYQQLATGQLLLNGSFGKDSVHIDLKKIPLNGNYFKLTQRGFHWINELSFNN